MPFDALEEKEREIAVHQLPLTQEQIELLVEHVANKVFDRVIQQLDERLIPIILKRMTDNLYREAGRAVINKLMWLVGICVIGFCVWIVSSGKVKLGIDP